MPDSEPSSDSRVAANVRVYGWMAASLAFAVVPLGVLYCSEPALSQDAFAIFDKGDAFILAGALAAPEFIELLTWAIRQKFEISRPGKIILGLLLLLPVLSLILFGLAQANYTATHIEFSTSAKPGQDASGAKIDIDPKAGGRTNSTPQLATPGFEPAPGIPIILPQSLPPFQRFGNSGGWSLFLFAATCAGIYASIRMRSGLGWRRGSK